MLKLMYITNQPDVAKIADENGVDRIFVDLEKIGKKERQGGMDTVQSQHSIENIPEVKNSVKQAEVLVRVNPIHEKTEAYSSSEEEIEEVIKNGADIIMLPFFKTLDEVQRFFKCVDGRVRTCLLLETPEAVEIVDEILALPEVKEIHIGLNDLALGYGKKFMFELLADGTVERLCQKFRKKGISYGFGGIAALGKGMLPSEHIIKEHYRLGSTCAILSRSFCSPKETDLDIIRKTFENGIREIRELETECKSHCDYFVTNRSVVIEKVNQICK